MEKQEKKRALAIAAVPVQPWGELYGRETAFRQGTVFKDLDLPFFASDSLEEPVRRPSSEDGQAELMQELCEVSFLLDDFTLYLDTHPEDKQAWDIYQENNQKRKELKETFAKRFYPLTRDCMAFCGDYGWENGVPPWEGGCC